MIKKYLSIYRVMSGSGVGPGKQTLTQSTERAKEQAARRVPNQTAKIPRKPSALEDFQKWDRETNHGRYLARMPLPYANMSQSEAQIRALGLSSKLTDTVLLGNSEEFAKGIYRAREPEARLQRREALEAMKKSQQFTQMPKAVKEQIEERKRLVQEQTLQAEISERRPAMPQLRITGENIFWGQHVPSKPKEIIWGGEIFARLPKEQQKNIYTLSNSIRSGNKTAENLDKYKKDLDNLIRLDPQTSITLKNLITSKLQLDNINIIKAYWNRYNSYNYSIEPDEIHFFIFDWISKNTVFTEERFVIFNQFISDRIKSKVEESQIPSPEPDPYPEFNRRKRELIIRLYLYPDINTQEVLNYFMNDEEQDRFKPRLMRELNLRQTKCNEIYELAETLAEFNPRMVIEDCKLLENQLRRITQRMQKLYPMYRDEEVYPATQSRSIIDSLLQQELFSRFMSNEELQPQVEFIDYTSQVKKLAKSYRTTEFECLKTIENLHKKPEEENLKGGGKTRKNKRKN